MNLLTCRPTFAVVIVAAIGAAGHFVKAQPQQPVGTWASIGEIAPRRIGAAAVPLPDGRTLIAGGLTADDGSATDAVDIYDPAANSSETIGHMLAPRVGHAAVRLTDGRIAVVGGTADGAISSDIEVFDPASGRSTLVALTAQPRTGHVAAVLSDGRVLIAGGTTVDGMVLGSAELFDPANGSVAAVPAALQQPRTDATATPLIDGRLLVAGGNSGSEDLATAEIFDPYSESFVIVDTQLSRARAGHTAVLLPHNNSVLVAGGTASGVAVAAADLFLPAEFPDPYSYGTGRFAPTGTMIAPRAGAIGGSASAEGYAFVAGGGAADAESYRFATIKTDRDDYAPGERAVITGSGWQPGEAVRLLFQEDPAVHDDYVLTVQADSDGTIYWDRWAPDLHDLGVRFYLMASDSKSRAQTTFTDDVNVKSLAADCETDVSSFTSGTTVCARAAGFGGGSAGATVTIKWFAPGGGPATRTTVISGARGNVIDTFAPTVCGTWTLQASDGSSSGTDTFQVTNCNVPPTITRANAAVTVDEGQTAANTGTWSDANPSDTVTLSASIGDVIKSGTNASGTWSWSYAATDGPHGEIVTITANDGHGGVSTATFTLTINNVAPAIAAIPDATITEGSAWGGGGSFTDPGDDTWTATVDYGDGSGVQPLALTGTAFSLGHTYADNGVYTGTVVVTDSDGASDTETFQVTVANVAPSVEAGVGGTINEGGTFAGGGSFSDPGADSWTATVDYGDGSGVQALPLSGTTLTLGHAYGDNGTYTVTVTVTDDDGGAGSDTLTVIVNNVAPSGSGMLTFNPYTGAASASASFSDPGWRDVVQALFNWGAGSVAGSPASHGPALEGPLTGTFTSGYQFAPGCITNALTVRVADDDGGDFQSVLAAADTLDVYNVGFLAPIKDGVRSIVKLGNVIPVKLSIVDCHGQPVLSRTLSIWLYAGILNPADVSEGTELIAATSVSGADTDGIMRVADGHYMYNLATKGLTANLPYTIVVKDGAMSVATAVIEGKK